MNSTSTHEFVSGPVLDAWQRLLRVHGVIVRTLDQELQAAHGITLSDYDALLQLRDADEACLKMSELSRRTLITRSGMTRLVQGLERDGFVERLPCPEDARVSYAQLTDAGRAMLAQARATHHAGIRRAFAGHFDEAEAIELARLLGKLPGALDRTGPCSSEAEGA